MYYCIGIDQFKKDIAVDSKYMDLSMNGHSYCRIYLSKQKTGYGFKHFMICPICGSRHTELFYYNAKFMCRKCYPKNIYKGIQNIPRGGNKYIAYRMHRYAAAQSIEIKRFPFNYADYEKPVHRKESTWVKNLEVLQALENMRYQSLAYHKEWSSKTIKSILTWNNSLMYLFDLSEMQDRRNLIYWDKGVDLDINL